MNADLQFDFLVDKENNTMTIRRSSPPNGNWSGIAIRKASCSTNGLRPNRSRRKPRSWISKKVGIGTMP